MSGILALWADDAPSAAATLAAVGRHGAPPMSVQGRILVLGHLAEAQYRLGDWDAAAANGALAVSLVRDAGVLLGAGPTNALAAHVAAGRGAWDAAEERVATAVLAAELLPWWGARAHAATARAVLAQARGDHAAMLEALAVYDDPTVHDPVDGVGVLPWRALRVEALLGLGRTDEARRRARRAGGAGGPASPGLVGAGGGPAAVRDRRDTSGSRRGAPGVRRGDGARGEGARRAEPGSPGDRARPVPARGRRAPPRRRPAADRARAARPARRRAVPRPVRRAAARRRSAPARRRRRPSSSPRRSSPSPAWSPRAGPTRRPARRCS